MMDALKLWHALAKRTVPQLCAPHASPPNDTSGDSAGDKTADDQTADDQTADAELAQAVLCVCDLPMSRRAVFCAFAPMLYEHGSAPLQDAALRLVHGSSTPTALRMACHALNSDDRARRMLGLDVLRVASQTAPLRWSHALFHPRVDVRREAIDTLPNPQAAAMLPWLRTDPDHGDHAAVTGAPVRATLAIALWARGSLSDAAAADAVAGASPAEVFAIFRGAPQRNTAEQDRALGVSDTDDDDDVGHDVADHWCALWQALPHARAALTQTLIAALVDHRAASDREAVKRRIAAALKLHVDRTVVAGGDSETDELAAIAITCVPLLLGAQRWDIATQRRAVRRLHPLRVLLSKPTPTMDTVLASGLGQLEDGTVDITVALNLAVWCGKDPATSLTAVGDPPAVFALIAATPQCWPALARWGDSTLTPFITDFIAAHPEAGLQVVTLGMGRWACKHDEPLEVLKRFLTPARAATVLGTLSIPPDCSHLAIAAARVLGPRLGPEHVFDVVNALRGRLDIEVDVPAVLVRVLLAHPTAIAAALVRSASRPDAQWLLDSLVHDVAAWAEAPAHREALAQALRRRGPDGRGSRPPLWTQAQWPAIVAKLDACQSDRETTTEPLDTVARAAWLVKSGRVLADIIVQARAEPDSVRAAAWLGAVATALTEAAPPDADAAETIGTPAVALQAWITATPTDVSKDARGSTPAAPGLDLVLGLLEQPPQLAEPAAAIVAALLAKPTMAPVVVEHRDLIASIAPDICVEARRHLHQWPQLDEVPIRDCQARPWLSGKTPVVPPSDDSLAGLVQRCYSDMQATVLAAVSALIGRGAPGQDLLLGLLTATPLPLGAEIIARSVARFTDNDVLARAEALTQDEATPVWIRFRVGLGLAPADVAHWLPRLLIWACGPLQPSPDGPTSWFSPNDWDGLVALARLDRPAKPGHWLRRIVDATRRRFGGDAEGTLRLARSLIASPHPHAHRSATPHLLVAESTPEIDQARRAALSSAWWLPDHTVAQLLDAVDEPALTVPLQLMRRLNGAAPESLGAAVPESSQALAAQVMLDAVLVTAVGTLQACATAFESLHASVDLDSAWRALVAAAPSGSVRDAAIVHIEKRRSDDEKISLIARAFAWGIREGRDLTGSFYDVRMTKKREALGYTIAGQSTLYVSPGPILQGNPDGRAIVEGLVLHELGHHIHHYSPRALQVWARARASGLGSLLNLVADEHLERNLRAVEAGYGDRLKRLARYAFQELTREVSVTRALNAFGPEAFAALSARPLDVAEADDAIAMRGGQVLSELDRTGHPLARFVRALRMGLGNRHGDPVLEQALALFKGGFRQLDMDGLFRVTKQLARLYGSSAQDDDRDETGAGSPSLLDIFGGHETLPQDNAAEAAGLHDTDVQRELVRIFEPPKPPPSAPARGSKAPVINVGSTATFRRITAVTKMTPDRAAHREIARQLRRHAERLRRDFERLGLNHEKARGRLSGRAFDRTKTLAVVTRQDPRMLVARKLVIDSDLFLGVAIDCSGSMEGKELDKARRFGVLLAEAARGMSNVDAHFIGFTDRTLYDAGTAKRCAVSQLRSSGGNNDAAALAHLAGLARGSRRRARLLIMISDGLPTECSTTALRTFVLELSRRHKMQCAQIAVTRIAEPCFEHYIEVLDDDIDTSVRRFGQIVLGLATKTIKR